mmetsp:Transcript_15170/g.17526  ORF Transcript_15170/g.17526 Transcript_15170/m.17526 type:complete len:236 (-) Transcript_15170:190-897(-)
MRQVVLRVHHLTTDALDRFMDEGGNLAGVLLKDVLHVRRILLASVGITSVLSAVWIRHRGHEDVTGMVVVVLCPCRRSCGEARGDASAGAGGAVVGVLQARHALTASVNASKAQCQVIRLAAAVHKVADGQLGRDLGLELLSIADDRWVKVPRVTNDVLHGGAGGIDEVGVAVAHVAHIAVAVHVRLLLVIKAVLHRRLDQHQRLGVEMVLTGTQVCLASQQHILGGGTVVWLWR